MRRATCSTTAPRRSGALLVSLLGGLLLGGCTAPGAEVVVLLGGDVHGEPPIAAVLEAGEDPLAAVRPVLQEADLVVVNLETPTARGGKEADKDIIFNADPVLLERLAAAGVHVVNLANNHALDLGAAALAETVRRAEDAGLAVVGAGADAEAAWAPAVVEAGDRRVAVLGMTDVVPDAGWVAHGGWGVASALDHERAAAAVRRAAATADHVVVTVHWGNEFRECPSVVQTELAARLVAAGADVVGGHHPHVVQGLELRDGAVVAYSLGNLVFYAASPETRDAVLLRVALNAEGGVGHAVLPVVIDDLGRPHRATADEAARIYERVRVRSPGGGTCPAAVWGGLQDAR
jgi:poly-gamma-glutamate capsule biosynthesis protein CapA/YwtB (metallophosphatase superfamily)